MNMLPTLKNRRVLVIDDNRAIHDDFRKILSPALPSGGSALDATEAAVFGGSFPPGGTSRQTEFEVDSAYQGQEGVLLAAKALAAGRPYAMAFVDVRMPPGWDGVETTAKLWELDPNLQVVLCTAYSDYSWGEMFEQLGQRDGLLILKKPFDAVEALQLAQALTEKWWLHQQTRQKMEELERRVAERTQELAGSLSLLNATIESTTDGIVAVDLSGKVGAYNAKFAGTWQFPADMLTRRDAAEMRGHTAGQVKDPANFCQRIKELEADPEADAFDVIELKDGRTFERYVFPQRIDGRCVGSVINWRDITERRRGEIALEESKRFLRSTLDALSSHIAILDEHGTIIEVNAVWNRFAATNEFRGQHRGVGDNYLQLCDTASGKSSEEAPLVAGGIRAVIAGQGGEFELEYPCHSPQEKRWFIVRATRFDGDGPVRVVVAHENITQRRQAENLVRQSEERYRSLITNARDAIFTIGADGTFTSLNPAVETMGGLLRADWLGKPFAAMVHPDDLPQALEMFQRIMKGEQTPVHELRGNPNLKRPALIEMTLAAQTDEGGKIIGLLGIGRDITERRRAETALAESQSQYRALFENMVEGYAYCRLLYEEGRARDFIYLEVNRAFESLTGLKDVTGKKVSAVIPGHLEDLKELFELYCRVALTGHPERCEVQVKALGLWFSISVYSSEKQHFVAVFDNITERKRAELVLRESEATLKESQVIANLGSYVLDIASGTWSSSEVLNHLFGIDAAYPRSVAGWFDLIHPDDRAMMTGYFNEEVLGQRRPFNKEYRILRHADRTERWVNGLGKLEFDSQDRPVKMIGTIQDITERKKLEVQLFQSQKLETVGKLAGGIAHEFNSILTAILGQSELMLGDLPAGSPLVKNATEINKAAARAATLTRQLLAYGRKQFLQPETLDLNQVIASLEGMFYQLMGSAVDTQIVPAPDLRTVKADAGQIEQVIMNMAINARDAMPNGGKLTLETSNVSFDQESVARYPELKPGDYVMLAITDTGAGMSAEIKARVFEPFFTTKDIGQGTGLGLSTCDGIIKQSGGHISVYSELGRGTTFKIYLPQSGLRPQMPVQSMDAPDWPRGTETILLVEDDPALREMAATLLRRLGYTVFTAANGLAALSLKAPRDAGPIDLLFTDVVMPHMSGKELADRVQALYPHTRKLFASAYTEKAMLHQGVLAQGVAMLQKPFTPSALAHKVREVLDQPADPQPESA